MKFRYPFLFVFSILLVYSCYKESDYDEKEISADRLFEKISISKDTLLANDADEAILTVRIPLDLKDSYNLVKVKTSHGVFTETSKNEAETGAKIIYENGEQQRVAIFHLKSSLTPGKAKVDFSINNVSTQKEVTIVENPATNIKIIPSALYMIGGPAGELSFKTLVGSDKGKVTPGQIVQIWVKDEDNLDKGTLRVRPSRSDAAGENNFIYSIIPDTSFTGVLIIRAECLGHMDSLNIVVVK
ncbi:hypothetical protein [Flavihumibacter sp. CACIAM 22H1]|uniref:hypothetical protein n=1 Tax=Flavihumibacter sp. CACIAM 22H1 TaxID=1812911 RepID=UPI0007A9263F|nr:hypothetical protein [Flavihumibacter sp. CACIAM 22H1]KYP16178.1 MAG: hypothetical protein A1D16_14025 [Flavihumibacter sp. CACIAM 22H1]